MSDNSIDAGRWLAKKAARLGVAAGSAPLTLMPSHANRLRVLTYHRFAVLERQMAWLGASGLATRAEAVPAVLDGGNGGGGRVLVTIDDGDPTVIGNAAPIFARHNIPYIIYVVPGLVGRRRHMSVAHLRELSDAGVEIGSHTMTHRSVTSMSSRELAAELRDSKKWIEDLVGRDVTSFAYPFGTLRDFNGRTAEALRRAGYRFAFTSQHGAVDAGLDAMMLPRIKIEGGDPDWLFRAACRGAMDQWRFVDAALAGMQKPQAKDLGAPAQQNA